MAGYGYATNGYTTYDNVKPLYQGYTSNEHMHRPTYNNIEPLYQGYVSNKLMVRPVMVDSQGRKNPIISYTRPGYVPKRESTYVDRIQNPDYTYNNYEGPQEYDPYITKVNQTESTHNPAKHASKLWQKTSPAPTYTWTKPKKSHQSTTTTTGLAADFIGRAITEAAPPAMQPLVQKVETYVVETIDNREATKGYARPVFKQPAQETYLGY